MEMRFPEAEEPDADAMEKGRLLFAGETDFVKGVVAMDGLPPADRVEVCFAGRSNVGKSSPTPPFSKTSRAVASAAVAASAPRQSAVTSLAKRTLASLISDPPKAPSRSQSSIDNSVNIFRNFPTSASSTLRHHCQNS